MKVNRSRILRLPAFEIGTIKASGDPLYQRRLARHVVPKEQVQLSESHLLASSKYGIFVKLDLVNPSDRGIQSLNLSNDPCFLQVLVAKKRFCWECSATIVIDQSCVVCT